MRPPGSYVDHWDARHQHWRRLWENSDSVDGKDVHTFQKPLVGQGRRRLFRMALSHREKTAGKRATNAGSPPGDSETKRRKRCVAYPGFIDGASSWLALKRSGSKLKAWPRVKIPWDCGGHPRDGQCETTRATHAHAPSSLGGKLGLYSSLVEETAWQETPVVTRKARPTRTWEDKAASSHNLGSAPWPPGHFHGA